MTYEQARVAAAALYSATRDECRALAEMRMAVVLAEAYVSGFRDACAETTLMVERRIAEQLGPQPTKH